MAPGASGADAAAASVGASDLFVLRRVRDDQFVHFGGSGRGAGWAGLIEVTSGEERPLAQALATRNAVRVCREDARRVFGPYFAKVAAFVPVTNDIVVVFGSDDDDLAEAGEERLRAAAAMAAQAVEAVSPAKRLADELEELEGVRAMLAVDTTDVAAALAGVCRTVAAALSCELAVAYLHDGDRLELHERGWALQAPRAHVVAALRGALDEERFPFCVQDASVVALPPPLDREPGIRSYYLLELQGIARGVLFVAHTDSAPRGFTLLCRRLGLRLADVAAAQLGLALTREWCAAEAGRLHAALGALQAS